MTGLWESLADLVLPTSCAGCGRAGSSLTFDVCPGCVRRIEALRPHATRPTPAPPGLPACFALGEYGDELRELIISYKDRGRHRLARPLGALLAEVVAAAVPEPKPLLLLYVPDTGRAARERYGDHMRRLALAAAERLEKAGRVVAVRRAVAARAKADSAGLDVAAREREAQSAFFPSALFAIARRAATRRTVVLLDDIVTTGSTLAAASKMLAQSHLTVDACAVLAATKRRLPA